MAIALDNSAFCSADVKICRKHIESSNMFCSCTSMHAPMHIDVILACKSLCRLHILYAIVKNLETQIKHMLENESALADIMEMREVYCTHILDLTVRVWNRWGLVVESTIARYWTEPCILPKIINADLNSLRWNFQKLQIWLMYRRLRKLYKDYIWKWFPVVTCMNKLEKVSLSLMWRVGSTMHRTKRFKWIP